MSAGMDIVKEEAFTVGDIHCESCERTIRTLVGDVAGVIDVTPDHRTNKVTISYEEQRIGSEELRTALTDAGYPPA